MLLGIEITLQDRFSCIDISLRWWGEGSVFQHDNAPAFTACLTKNVLHTNDISYGVACHANCYAWGGGYSHIRTVRVCVARNPSIFWPGPLRKSPLFRPGPPRKTPLFKNKHLFVPLFQPGLLQKTRPPFQKIYVSLLVLVPKSPRFSVKAPIFSEGPLPKPPIFKLWAAHIYHFHTWVSHGLLCLHWVCQHLSIQNVIQWMHHHQSSR